jgi:hypothetical protein
MSPNDRQLIEKIEVLDGSRPGALRHAAVRIVDLSELLQLAEVRTKEVAAAPTQADFNALLRDVKEINLRLKTIADMLQARLMR